MAFNMIRWLTGAYIYQAIHVWPLGLSIEQVGGSTDDDSWARSRQRKIEPEKLDVHVPSCID